ncbi:MAG: hypothetical protein KBA95_06510 [Acidobacteria bacterium]|nr:hypothetical protein [Acidobacteriota bacterium]
MPPATPLEEAIDRLYALPLDEFVAARNELAKQFRGDDGKTIRALSKPSAVAWALNQLYWSARPVFDRLVAAAAKLREAQASGLLGKQADLRGADAAHREALLAAVREAARILEHARHDAGSDALRSLTAALEALPWEDRPGRLARPPGPVGFAAFAGMPIAKSQVPGIAPRAGTQPAPKPEAEPPADRKRERGEPVERTKERKQRARGQREQHEREQEQRARAQRERDERHREMVEAARREAAAAAERLRAAEGQLARARNDEREARERLEATRRLVKDAEKTYRVAEREAAAAARKAGAQPGS